ALAQPPARRDGPKMISTGRTTSESSSIADAAVVIDPGGLILEFDLAAERMFGYSRDDALGMAAELLIQPSLRAKYRAGFHQGDGKAALVGKGVELSARRSDGSTF